MSAAKPVSLSVRPFQVSHLCFEVGGIVEGSLAQLGAKATAFDFPAFYTTLSAVPTVAGDPSKLLYDSLAIEAAVAPFALVALRKEGRKAALNNAINARQNAYFAKYANAPAIIAKMNEFYSTSSSTSKPRRLEVLRLNADFQFVLLKGAYERDGRTDVVRTTGSVLNSTTQSGGQSTTIGQSNLESLTAPVPTRATLGSLPAGGGSLSGWGSNAENGPSHQAGEEFQEGTSGITTQSSGSASQSQTIVNTDYGYRIPYYENAAQMERAQISLIDQEFAQFMFGQNLGNLAQVFQNELNSIDSNVLRQQIALLSTILMSPISGVITGIYKNPGDAVKAGEPVIRVEDNTNIYLIATIVHRGPIVVAPPPPTPPPVNSTVTVTTPLFDASGPLTTLTGSVVSARGHRDDDMWDLIVKCNNPLDSSGNPIVPLGYHFDYDDTTISIS
jgi:hypothetical protein